MACRNGVCSRNSSSSNPIAPPSSPVSRAPIPTVQAGAPDNRSWWQRLWGQAVGENAKNIEVPRGFTPQQLQALDSLLQGGMTGLGRNFDLMEDVRNQIGQNQQNFGIEPNLERARRDFESKTIPSIANRFLAGSSRGSGALKAALGSAGSDLESNLNALRNQFGQQQFSNLLGLHGQLLGQQGQFANLAQLGLQPRNEILYQPENWGLLGKLVGVAPQALAAYYGGNSIAQALLALRPNQEQQPDGTQQVTQNSQQQPIQFQQPEMSYQSNQMPQPAPIGNINPASLASSDTGIQLSPLSQVQQLVQNLGTSDYRFKHRNDAFNYLNRNRFNNLPLTGRGY